MIKEDLKTRFLKKILIDDKTGCWNWTASGRGVGYGCLKIEGKVVDSHRVSWMLFQGNIPENMLVCHKCDNVFCINPDHLFLGTHQDNMDDKMSKKRNPDYAGERNPSAKLTSKQVIEIRNIEGLSQRQIAKIYKITQTMVGYIRRKENWKHLKDGEL